MAAALMLLMIVPAGCTDSSDDRTVSFHDGGAAATTVTVPDEAGKPAFTVLPEPSAVTLPVGVRPLARPVRVETPEKVAGTATITMTYDPAAVSDLTDLAIYTYVEDIGTWLPAGDTVDPVKHTVSATTQHFSDWMPAVTDPDRLRYDQTLTERLKRTTGGRIAGLMYGEPRALSCDANRLLVPAAVRSSLIVGRPKLCQQVADDGTYELEWINNTELPIVFDLPDGVTETTRDYRVNPMLQGVLQQHRRSDGAIVLPDRSLKVKFAAASPPIKGELDWSIYLIALMRQIVEIALLDESTDNPGAREKLDLAFEGTGWVDCAGAGINEWNDTHNVNSMVYKAVWDCKDKLAVLVLETVATLAKGALNSLKKFLSKRLEVLLGLDPLMAFARSEIAGLLALPGALTGQLDTTVTVQPGRFMTYEEARGLPAAKPFGDSPTCGILPSGQWPPAGMPDVALCLQAVELDLDGNGKRDRLLTWRPRRPVIGAELDRKLTGAVAYLDDGTFHLLEKPVRTWTEIETLDVFDMAAAVRLGSDRRAQALLVVGLGSSSLYHVALAIDRDKRLRPVTVGGKIPDIVSGSAAAYGSAWGCALSKGRPVFVLSGWFSEITQPAAPRQWSRTFLTYDNAVLTELGNDRGTIAPAKLPVTGSNCASRGPEIGTVRKR